MKIDLPSSGYKVTFNEISMETYEKILDDPDYGNTEKVTALKTYLGDFVCEIKDKGGTKVEGKKYGDWFKTLSAKDGIVILTKMNLILNETSTVLGEMGLDVERDALAKKLQPIEKPEE